MPLTRDQAQQRADDIQAFRREAQRLQAEHAWPLDDAPLAQIAAHHEQLLAQYRAGFDIDPDQQSKRLSLSMRIVSLLGALALAASLLFLFYQFWGLFGEATQVGILLGFSLGSLLLTFALRRRDPSGYFAKLAATLALACFMLNIYMLGQIFNITPSDKALLPWGAYALLLAYACNARLLLVIGLVCLLAFCVSRIGSLIGFYWLYAGERPENLLLPGLLLPLVLVLVYALNFAISTVVGRAMFKRGDAIALVYGTVMRYLSIALAIAMGVFGSAGADAALLIALAYIVQVQAAAWYVKLTDRLFGPPPAPTPAKAA